MKKLYKKRKKKPILGGRIKKKDDRQIYRTFRKYTKKIVLEKKISWDKRYRKIEAYIGGRRCTEAWKLLKNIRKEGSDSW